MHLVSRQTHRSCMFAMSIMFLSVAPTQAEQVPIIKAAYFDDGNDKQAVTDLRERRAKGEALTEEETAILVAASRTGKIGCDVAGGKENFTNGFITEINGREAIITSGHAFIDKADGSAVCDLTKVWYYPNFSFFDKSNGAPTDFERRKVKTDGKLPLNLEVILGRTNVPTHADFLIFFVSSKEAPLKIDKLPDDSIRGILEFSSLLSKDSDVYLIGTEPGFRKGTATAYQKCSSTNRLDHTVLHNCDTFAGASSSLVGKMEDGEIKIYGIHKYGDEETYSGDALSTRWNGAVSVTNLRDAGFIP